MMRAGALSRRPPNPTADDAGLTETQMAYDAGYKPLVPAIRALVRAGRLIADCLTRETTKKAQAIALAGSALVAFRGTPQNGADPGNQIFYPELRDAVTAIF